MPLFFHLVAANPFFAGSSGIGVKKHYLDEFKNAHDLLMRKFYFAFKDLVENWKNSPAGNAWYTLYKKAAY